MLTRAQAKPLLESIGGLRKAIWKAELNFDAQVDNGRWQQDLLLASRQVQETSDENLRAPYMAAKKDHETKTSNGLVNTP